MKRFPLFLILSTTLLLNFQLINLNSFNANYPGRNRLVNSNIIPFNQPVSPYKTIHD